MTVDSALYHAGGANTLARRALFHFSFLRPGAYPGGRFSSLLEELRGRCRLNELRWLGTDGEWDRQNGGQTEGATASAVTLVKSC
jgi:hypothetical protein